MNKINRLRSNKDFSSCVKKGFKLNTKYFIVFFKKNNLNRYRIGISVSKKVSKLSVQRNLIRRQIKSFFYSNLISLTDGVDVVIVVKQGYDTKCYFPVLQSLSNKLKEKKLVII